MTRLVSVLGRRIVLGALCVALVVPAARVARAAQLPIFRSRSELVVLAVTVERPRGGYVSALDADDFRVYEDGVARPISFFGREDIPIDLALLIDASASVADVLPLARRAAETLTGQLRDTDRVAVYSFSGRARLEQPFTTDRASIGVAIERIRSASTTSYYDAMNIALGSFPTIPADGPRRRALVVLSDGEDTTSLTTYDDVLERARRNGVGIYTVALGRGHDTPSEVLLRRQHESAYELRALATETGARSFALSKPQDLDGAYQSIADELAHQYCLAFVPRPQQMSRFTSVKVAVDQPGLQVRTRTGFIADAAAP